MLVYQQFSVLWHRNPGETDFFYSAVTAVGSENKQLCILTSCWNCAESNGINNTSEISLSRQEKLNPGENTESVSLFHEKVRFGDNEWGYVIKMFSLAYRSKHF